MSLISSMFPVSPAIIFVPQARRLLPKYGGMPQFTKSDPSIRRELRKIFRGSGRVVAYSSLIGLGPSPRFRMWSRRGEKEELTSPGNGGTAPR
jgi:hypothetical protein